MMSTSKISTVNKSHSTNRTGELLQNVWSSNDNAINEINEAGEFCFTGSMNPISKKISAIIDGCKEMLYISTSNLTDSEILSSIERAISRNVRVYMLIDSTNFQSFIDYEGSKSVKGHILTRERNSRGLDIVLVDWKLASKKGILLNNPLDGTLSVSNGNWCMDLYPNQVDALRTHTEHEFWSAEEGRELLSPTSKPEAINSAPYTLKRLENNDLILRSFYSLEGEENILKSSLINGLEWEYLSKGKSSKNSIVLEGKEVILGEGCGNILQCDTDANTFDSKTCVHSGFSLIVAIGESSFIAGWDRDATDDWHSLLKLNSSQEKTLISLIQQHMNNPEWIGHSKIKLGEAGNRIIRNGTEMEISDSQTQDLGVIHLDEMPDSAEVLQSHKPELIPPKDNLARECEFKWISAPPVPSTSASKDGLHTEWDNARDSISKRLNALDELNVVSKIPGFGRKAKELQKSIEDSVEKLGTINDPKSLSDLVDEVEKLTKSVGGNLDAIKAAEDEEARQKLEDEQRETHKLAVEKAIKSIKSLEPRLKKMNGELDKLKKSAEKAKDVEKKKLESDVSQLTPKIQQLGSELKKARDLSNSKFEFKAPPTLPSSKKKDSKSHKFLGDTRESKLEVKTPKEGLPQFGTLFKDGDARYLAVSDWTHVEQGRKDAKRLNATLCAVREVLQ
ncbi:FAM83 family protein [Candidatus Poseidonia alphae]|nr:FAM83 family protein [Candidatus Poseidonia alphae]